MELFAVLGFWGFVGWQDGFFGKAGVRFVSSEFYCFLKWGGCVNKTLMRRGIGDVTTPVLNCNILLLTKIDEVFSIIYLLLTSQGKPTFSRLIE